MEWIALIGTGVGLGAVGLGYWIRGWEVLYYKDKLGQAREQLQALQASRERQAKAQEITNEGSHKIRKAMPLSDSSAFGVLWVDPGEADETGLDPDGDADGA